MKIRTVMVAKWFACVLGAAVLFSPLGAAAEADNAAKLAEVQTAIDDLNRQLEDIKSQRSELEVELEASEKQISEAMQRVADIKMQIKEEEAKQGALSSEKK